MEHIWENVDCQNSLDTTLVKLVNNEAFADIQFHFTNGQIIYAHSFILSIRSSQLYREIKNSVEQPKIIPITKATFELFLEFIQYLYTNDLNLVIYNVFELFKLSKQYYVPSLERKCNAYLFKKLSDETACEFLQLALIGNCADLFKTFHDFIAQNYLPVLMSSEFLEINDETLKSIITLDTVSDVDEFEIFSAIIKWTNRACEKDGIISPTGTEQRQKLGDNFQWIRFEAMNPSKMVDCEILAPNFLKTGEINLIKSKHLAGANYVDNKRKQLVVADSDFSGRGCLCFRATSFEWSNYKLSELKETYFIEFKVSKAIKISEFDFDIKESPKICYRILENGKILLKEENTVNEYSLKVSTPIRLQQYRRYRFEYEILNLAESESVEAYKHVVNEKRMKMSGCEDINCTIFEQNAHIYLMYFEF